MVEHVFSKTARYYDKLYAKKDYAAEANHLISFLNIKTNSNKMTLLDVACGTGLHLEHFVRHFNVQGLDICTELLEIARKRIHDVSFHLGDMTNFDIDRKFDIVTCLFSSIGYVKTLDKLKDAVCRIRNQPLATPAGKSTLE